MICFGKRVKIATLSKPDTDWTLMTRLTTSVGSFPIRAWSQLDLLDCMKCFSIAHFIISARMFFIQVKMWDFFEVFRSRKVLTGSPVAFDVLRWVHFLDDLQGCPNARWQIASW